MRHADRGRHRVREFRDSPITAPDRRFQFQVVDDTPCPWGALGPGGRVHAHARVSVREDPQKPGGVLVTVWGDNIRVVWRGRDDPPERAGRPAGRRG